MPTDRTQEQNAAFLWPTAAKPPEEPHPTEANSRDPAVRDAVRISDRIRNDETAADAAREAYRSAGLPILEDLPGHLDAGENLHAVHRLAMVELGADRTPRGGTLMVTSRRLVHRGTDVVAWPLEDIDEMSVALERLLLLRLTDGTDVAVEVDVPRLLRVQLAAAMAALRTTAEPEAIAG
jgi:hypothetical protein